MIPILAKVTQHQLIVIDQLLEDTLVWYDFNEQPGRSNLRVRAHIHQFYRPKCCRMNLVAF
jgi:hypothetical protein